MNETLELALRYAERGFAVFPCKGKVPLPGTRGFKDATKDPDEIRKLFTDSTLNIGIATGEVSGVVAIDVDEKAGGKASLQRLEEMYGNIFTETVHTGGGGYHFYCQHPGYPIRNTVHLWPGIDIRGDGGYVIAPPSTHASGNQYRWENFGSGLAPLPEWVETKLKDKIKAYVSTSESKSIKEQIIAKGGRDPYLMSCAGKLRRMGSEYEEILRYLQVVNQNCEPPKEQADLERIAKNVCRYEPSAIVDDDKLALEMLVLNSILYINTANREEARLIDVKDGNEYPISPDVIRTSILGRKRFDTYMATNSKPAFFEYRPNALTYYYWRDNFPYYNLYKPPKWRFDSFFFGKPLPTNEKLPEIYEQFFRHLTKNDEPSFVYLLDWMANSLRERNLTILTTIGTQGVGKGTLGHILRMLHGEKNFVRVRDQVFKAQFNAPLAYKTLVYVDEVDLRTKEAHNRMKDVVNDVIEIERKGRDPIEIENFASFYLSSNSMSAVKIEAGDRRFSIIELTDKPLKDTPLRDSVTQLLKPENIASLGAYLMGRKITSDMMTPFKSAHYYAVKDAGLSDWEEYVLYEWAPENAGKKVDLKDVKMAVKEELGLRYMAGRQKFEDLATRYDSILKFHRTSAGICQLESLIAQAAPRSPFPWPTLDDSGRAPSVSWEKWAVEEDKHVD